MLYKCVHNISMIAQLITTKLIEKGFRQEEIAKHLGCAQSNVSLLYTGKTKNPSFGLCFALIKLAKENGIEVPGIEFAEREAGERSDMEETESK